MLVQCESSTKQRNGVEESVSGVSMEDSCPKPEQGNEVDNCDSEGDGGSGSDEVDEDEGWITPDNIDQARIEMGGCVGEELGDVRVGCMTTDFAMQVSDASSSRCVGGQGMCGGGSSRVGCGPVSVCGSVLVDCTYSESCDCIAILLQNVLLQIGLDLISPDGMVIKEVRTYVLQCKACFK